MERKKKEDKEEGRKSSDPHPQKRKKKKNFNIRPLNPFSDCTFDCTFDFHSILSQCQNGWTNGSDASAVNSHELLYCHLGKNGAKSWMQSSRDREKSVRRHFHGHSIVPSQKGATRGGRKRGKQTCVQLIHVMQTSLPACSGQIAWSEYLSNKISHE